MRCWVAGIGGAAERQRDRAEAELEQAVAARATGDNNARLGVARLTSSICRSLSPNRS